MFSASIFSQKKTAGWNNGELCPRSDSCTWANLKARGRVLQAWSVPTSEGSQHCKEKGRWERFILLNCHLDTEFSVLSLIRVPIMFWLSASCLWNFLKALEPLGSRVWLGKMGQGVQVIEDYSRPWFWSRDFCFLIIQGIRSLCRMLLTQWTPPYLHHHDGLEYYWTLSHRGPLPLGCFCRVFWTQRHKH